MHVIVRATAAAVAACVAAPAALAQQPTFTPLGFAASGHFRSSAYAVSADGSVVVGASEGPSGTEAFMWTAATGMVSLGDFAGGLLDSHATGVSNDGTVVVGTATSPIGRRPFRWTAAGGMIDLGGLAGGDGRGRASGVSADGSVVVGASSIAGGGSAAFRWTSQAGMVSLGTVAGGSAISEADGVSADGSTVVGFAWLNNRPVPVRWTASAGMVALTDSVGGTAVGVAHAASADGAMIVGYRSMPGVEQQAFRWTAAGGLVSPGSAGADVFPAVATGVSDSGQMLVGRTSATGAVYAVLWDEYYGLTHLGDALSTIFGLGQQLQGWTLRSVYAVSGDGYTLVGEGINPSGQVEAWVARANIYCRPPVIFEVPYSDYIPEGAERTFTVDVRSPIPMTYQWTRNGTVLQDTATMVGTHSPTIHFLSFNQNEEGQYRLTTTNACGSVSTWEVSWLYRPPCTVDFNGDGVINPDDLGDYITEYFYYAQFNLLTFPAQVDFNADGALNPDDLGDYITAYYSATGAC